MKPDSTPTDIKSLHEALKKDPSNWDLRKRLAHAYYDQGEFLDASKVVWSAEELPNVDLELAFAARVLAKAAPRKAIRLLSALLEHNRGKPAQNLGLANALLHHGMVLQAARFYGAALEADPSLGNPDLEHFLVWTDDEETLWGDFKQRSPKLGVLPWMKRDPKEAMKLTSEISRHTTPIRVASLPPAPGEALGNELYEQKAERGAKPGPPPAVTIPMDRVEPKDRRFDPKLGAPSPPESPAPAAAAPAPAKNPEGPPASPSPASPSPAPAAAPLKLPPKQAAPAPGKPKEKPAPTTSEAAPSKLPPNQAAPERATPAPEEPKEKPAPTASPAPQAKPAPMLLPRKKSEPTPALGKGLKGRPAPAPLQLKKPIPETVPAEPGAPQRKQLNLGKLPTGDPKAPGPPGK